MRITAEELVERKKRIIYTAYELFCESGIDTVSMEKIAKKSRVSTNSIFRYFESKANLVQLAQEILWKEISDHVVMGSKTQIALAQNGFEEIEVLLFNFQDLYEKHSNYLLFACDYRLFLIRQHIQMSEQCYQELLTPVHDTFISALIRGQADGSVSNAEPVETQFFILWAVMRSFVDEIVIRDRMYSGVNSWREYFSLVLIHALRMLRGKW